MTKEIQTRGLEGKRGGAYFYRLAGRTLLPQIGDISVANLQSAVEASKSRPLANLLVGLNIRHLGSTGSQVLAGNMGSLDHVMDAGDESFSFGLATDRIVIGDWNGAGKDEVGVFREAVSSGFPAQYAGDAVFFETRPRSRGD